MARANPFVLAIIILNRTHIGLNITRCYESFFYNNSLFNGINRTQHYGHIGSISDTYKPGFPFAHLLASPFRRYRHAHSAGFFKLLNQCVGQRNRLFTIHRNTPKSSEYITEGKYKPRFFHQKTCFATKRPIREFTEDEIPIRGMRCYTDYTLWIVGHRTTDRPSK